MKPQKIYQKYLVDEFKRRRSRNMAYSLRAFARDLQVPSPKLSQYLKGSCGLSAYKASLIAERLGLGTSETELFVCAAEAAHARSPIRREQASEKLHQLIRGRFSEVDMEKFNLIRDWYHLAILELLEIQSFERNTKWIAESLGITEDEVREAVERLESLGFLRRGPQKWTQVDKDFETSTEISSRAIRDYHHQMLRLVSERFEQVPLVDREMSSLVFGIDQELIPDMKRLIRQFQLDAAALVERSEKKTALYTCNLQLMPIFQGGGK